MDVRIKKVIFDEEHRDESAQWIKRLIEKILVQQITEDVQIQVELLEILNSVKKSNSRGVP